MALATGTVVGNDSSIRISNAKNMFFLRFYHLGLMRVEIGSIVALGWGYFPHDSSHFVPGYYRAVPPGQKPFALRSPSHYLSAYGERGQGQGKPEKSGSYHFIFDDRFIFQLGDGA